MAEPVTPTGVIPRRHRPRKTGARPTPTTVNLLAHGVTADLIAANIRESNDPRAGRTRQAVGFQMRGVRPLRASTLKSIWWLSEYNDKLVCEVRRDAFLLWANQHPDEPVSNAFKDDLDDGIDWGGENFVGPR